MESPLDSFCSPRKTFAVSLQEMIYWRGRLLSMMKFAEWVFTVSLVAVIVDSTALMDDTSRRVLMIFLLVAALLSGIVVFGRATARR